MRMSAVGGLASTDSQRVYLAGMRGTYDPREQFTYLIREVRDRFPTLAYLHVVEPRAEGPGDKEVEEGDVSPCLPRVLNQAARTQIILCRRAMCFAKSGNRESDPSSLQAVTSARTRSKLQSRRVT